MNVPLIESPKIPASALPAKNQAGPSPPPIQAALPPDRGINACSPERQAKSPRRSWLPSPVAGFMAAGLAAIALALGMASSMQETRGAEPPAPAKKEPPPAIPLMPRADEPFKMPTPEQFKAAALLQEKREKYAIIASMIQKPATAEDIAKIQEHLAPVDRTWLELVKFHKVKIYVLNGGGKNKDAVKVSLPTSTVYRNTLIPKESLLVTGVLEETPIAEYKTAELQKLAEKLLKAGEAIDNLYHIPIEAARKEHVSAAEGTPEWQGSANKLDALYTERVRKVSDLAQGIGDGKLELLPLEKSLETSSLSPSSVLPDVAYRNGARKGEDTRQFLEALAFLNPALKGKDVKTLEVTTLGSLWDSGNHYLVVPTVYPYIHPVTKKTFWAEDWAHQKIEKWQKEDTSGLWIGYYHSAFLARGFLSDRDEGISTTVHEVAGHGGKYALQSLYPKWDKLNAKLEESFNRAKVLGAAVDPVSKYSLTNIEEFAAQNIAAKFSPTALPRLKALDGGRVYQVVQEMNQAAKEAVEAQKKKALEEEMKKAPKMPRIP